MKHSVISEEDFDSAQCQPVDPSPSINLGSHLPNPLSLSSKVPSGMTLPSGDIKVPSIEEVPSGDIKLGTIKKGGVWCVEKRDRINNVTQKEEAMAVAGVTRLGTYRVIVKLLSAKRLAQVVSKGGDVTEEWVDDLDKQRQGAELALKAFGDMIENKTIEYGIADSTLEALKRLSVSELRGRAAALLAGRVVVDAEVVAPAGVELGGNGV